VVVGQQHKDKRMPIYPGRLNTTGSSNGYTLVTEAFTAEINGKYAIDTTDGAFNVTLPASPASGNVVSFIDAKGTWDVNSPTFLRNGEHIEGYDTDIMYQSRGAFFAMVYVDTPKGWRLLVNADVPQNITPPTITGNTVGVAITSTPGGWSGTPIAYAYQWQISDDGATGWADITDATESTYTPISADEDKYVRLVVAGINNEGTSVPSESAPSEQLAVSTIPAGAVAFWSMNNTSDASGNGYTLTPVNSPTFGAGKINNAAYVNNTNYFQSSAQIGAGSWTIATWIYPTASGSSNRMIAADQGYQNLYFMEHGLALYFNVAGYSQIGGISVSQNQWVHVALTYDSVEEAVNLYVNGAPVASSLGNPPTSSFTVWPGALSNVSSPQPFVGRLDAYGIWNRALSGAEVTTLYNGGTGIEL
jgi:hypothetical protein